MGWRTICETLEGHGFRFMAVVELWSLGIGSKAYMLAQIALAAPPFPYICLYMRRTPGMVGSRTWGLKVPQFHEPNLYWLTGLQALCETESPDPSPQPYTCNALQPWGQRSWACGSGTPGLGTGLHSKNSQRKLAECSVGPSRILSRL